MAHTVVLVDTENRQTGCADSMDAHSGHGLLHRAFSVYVFADTGRKILVQRRSQRKMLWPGIWANTCCSHPFEHESAIEAGERRLREELGFTCPLAEAGIFVYRAEDPSGRGVEHEHVTILRGDVNSVTVIPDPSEVSEWMWTGVDELKKNMETHPELYAPWLHLGLQKISEGGEK